MVWGVPLTPLAAERVARESACYAFGQAARSISIDWHLPQDGQLDGKQIERWAHRLGDALVSKRDAEVKDLERGIKPDGPLNTPQLMVLGMDGGRVQMREKDAKTQSRWRENKVLSISSYLPGEKGWSRKSKGSESKSKPPRKLVTTYVATMGNAQAFGPMVAAEAYRRGLWQALVVLNISDGGNWIDPLSELYKLVDHRILDFHHADERLFEVASALKGKETPEAQALGKELENLLYNGKVEQVIAWMKAEAERLGPAQPNDGPTHVREVLRQNIGYFERHQQHMRYDEYRAKGWPIGSGNVEAGVKCFNKRVKGTEQFWHRRGVEAVMALRALWMSQDQRWQRHWTNRPAYPPRLAA
jgi:hypothetical protein